MSNTTAILAHLNLPKYDVVRDKLRADTLKWAEESIASFLEQVEKLTEAECADFDTTNRSYARFRAEFPSTGYAGLFLVKGITEKIREKISAKFHGILGKGYSAFKRETILAHKAEYVLNKKQIRDHADSQWEQHKAFYAARVGQKISELLEGDAEVSCDLSLSVALIGSITATLGEKKLKLHTSLKTNYRYGENAANREMTVYRQVPTLVASAEGFDVVARQQEIDRAVAQAKEDRKTALETLRTEIACLERRKRRWDDLYGTLSYCAKYNGGVLAAGNLQSVKEIWAKLGHDPEIHSLPTLASAKMMVKETREAVKAAKEKLKLARAAK